jgi:hypothetical protein
MDPAHDVVIVSGLPRTGTSMMMRMIEAGGVSPLTDGARVPDEDNPNGYYELEAVKRTRDDPSWLRQAHGKAVKLVSALLPDLPPAPGRTYWLVMMRRDLDEVLASQAKMLERSGKQGGRLAPDAMKRAFSAQMAQIDARLAARADVRRLDVDYHRVVADPAAEASRVAEFLGVPDAAAAMAQRVDPALYRNRRG